MSYMLYAHVQPGYPALMVGRRGDKDPLLPWLTPADVAEVHRVLGKRKLYLRLRDNQAGEVYSDEAWTDDIVH